MSTYVICCTIMQSLWLVGWMSVHFYKCIDSACSHISQTYSTYTFTSNAKFQVAAADTLIHSLSTNNSHTLFRILAIPRLIPAVWVPQHIWPSLYFSLLTTNRFLSHTLSERGVFFFFLKSVSFSLFSVFCAMHLPWLPFASNISP